MGGEVALRVRYGGDGPPVLLLHGHPRTHTTWYRLVPLLTDRYTLVCPDLRGYGQSSKPPTTADHAPYSKRAMAQDCLTLMHRLGHHRFTVVGHDRGGYVATPPGSGPPRGRGAAHRARRHPHRRGPGPL